MTGTEVRRGGGRAVGSAVLICGICACLAFAFWWRWVNLPPNISLPTVTLPPKNAYDFWVEAAGRISATDGELLRTALGKAPASGEASDGPSPAERKALLQRNAAALKTFREGLKHPYAEPSPRTLTNVFPHYAQFRQLARLARLDGLERGHGGDPAGALDAVLDGIQLGVEVPHEATNLGLLSGVSFQREARLAAWQWVERLTPAEARRLARRLEQICARQVPYRHTLEAEKWFGVACLQETLQRPGWRTDLQQFRLGTASGFPRSSSEAQLLARLATIGKREYVQNYIEHMDHLISIARMGYLSGTSGFPRGPEIATDALVPTFDLAHFVAVKEESLNGLLLTSLALRAYHGDHGRYPASLRELVPAYLKKQPIDPFAPLGFFKYEREGKGYKLYSVGADQDDHEGTPARSRSKRGNGPLSPLYEVERTSAGDLVPGVNY